MADVIIAPPATPDPGPDFSAWEQTRLGKTPPAAAAPNDGGAGGEGAAAAPGGEGEAPAASEPAAAAPNDGGAAEEPAPASEPVIDEEQELADLRAEAGKRGLSKRLLKALDRQTAKYNAEKAQRELLERQANGKPPAPAGETSTATPGPDPQTATPPDGKTWSGTPKPDPADRKFKTLDEYYEELGRWSSREEIAKARSEDAQRSGVERVNNAMARYVKEVPHAEFPDWNETIQAAAAQQAELTPTMAFRVFESGKHGGDPNYALGYYLAKHPAETKRIAALPPVEQVMELRFIEGQLSTRSGGAPVLKRTPAVRTAPKPPQTVDGGSAPHPTPKSTSDLSEDADFSQYEAVRSKQKR